MISKSAISNPGGAGAYYTDTQRAAEYYSGEQIPSAWRGQAAAAMGLTGKVDRQALTNILEGRVIERDPATGQPRERELGRTVIDKETGERSRQHRAGWDFTVSAPKSVSIQALVHGDESVLKAHRAAAAAALDYLERHGAQTRQRSGEFTKSDGLCIATFDHVASRAGDPQLHTHALIANVTTLDGKVYSLANEKLFEHRAAADAVYHNTLSAELQKAGYEVQHDAAGRAELAAYSGDELKDFSSRSAEIEAALAARGLTRATASTQQRDMATLATRSGKDLPETRAAHLAKWQAQAEALGIKPAHAVLADKLAAKATNPQEHARQAIDQAKAHLTEREAVFSAAQLHQQAARFSQGKTTQQAIENEIAAQSRSGALLRDGDRFTTHEARAAVDYAHQSLENGRGAHEAVLSPHEFDRSLQDFERSKDAELRARQISGKEAELGRAMEPAELLTFNAQREKFALSTEQAAAARMILTGDDRFQGVQGLAGTGKTTMLEFVRQAAEAKGWQVVGHSNGSEQAANMERESGIKSTTTAAHLIEQRRDLAERDIKPDHIAPPEPRTAHHGRSRAGRTKGVQPRNPDQPTKRGAHRVPWRPLAASIGRSWTGL